MGMTIDKAIDHGKDQLQIFGGEHKEFIELSIDIMHKYQKIKEQVEWSDKENHRIDTARMFEIKRIIDGNDNN